MYASLGKFREDHKQNMHIRRRHKYETRPNALACVLFLHLTILIIKSKFFNVNNASL